MTTLPAWRILSQAKIRKHLFNKIKDDNYVNSIRHHNHILPHNIPCPFCLDVGRDLSKLKELMK